MNNGAPMPHKPPFSLSTLTLCGCFSTRKMQMALFSFRTQIWAAFVAFFVLSNLFKSTRFIRGNDQHQLIGDLDFSSIYDQATAAAKFFASGTKQQVTFTEEAKEVDVGGLRVKDGIKRNARSLVNTSEKKRSQNDPLRFVISPWKQLFEGIDQSSLPIPVQVMEQYKLWHSDEAVRRDPHNRTYTLAFYTCPVSAGNRMHEFMNDLLFSVIMNRTLLWKYYDRAACKKYRNVRAKANARKQLLNCEMMNKHTDCEAILNIQSWIPSYSVLSKRLQLDKPSFVSNTSYGIMKLTEASLQDRQVVGIRPNTGSINFLDTELVRANGSSIQARNRANDLYHLGTSFTYGMAFHYLFNFSKELVSSVLPSLSSSTSQNDTLSVAVHSRHTDSRDDGTNVRRELKCINKIIPKGKTCLVYAMADREGTLSSLQNSLRTKCRVEIAEHANGSTHKSEHGPFSGAGFFQDLIVASQAEHGVVLGQIPGEKIRTSSEMLHELVEFNRKIKLWEQGRANHSEELKLCTYKEYPDQIQRRIHDRELFHFEPKTFESWQSGDTLPCIEQQLGGTPKSKYLEGFVYTQIHDVSSDPGASVTLRIAANIAKQLGYNNSCLFDIDNQRPLSTEKSSSQSFTWSLVGNPTNSFLDHFYTAAARQNIPTTFKSFTHFFHAHTTMLEGGYYLKELLKPQNKSLEALASQDVLSLYNFLGVAERLDESLVVLQMLLGLNTSDILYLTLPSWQGTYRYDEPTGTCYPNEKKVGPTYRMRKHIQDSHLLDIDEALYQAVNRSLDMTIEKLGYDVFQENLEFFQQEKATIDKACRWPRLKLACTNAGELREANETDCIIGGLGCGFHCIDSALKPLEKLEVPTTALEVTARARSIHRCKVTAGEGISMRCG